MVERTALLRTVAVAERPVVNPSFSRPDAV
jgi:hypothetical protein